MSYYVSVVSSGGTKKLLAAGPFKNHGTALKHVAGVRRVIHVRYPNDEPWVGVGTSHDKTRHDRIGKFNDDLGLTSEF